MIAPATISDYPDIMIIWELSVRATHDFLPEEYLLEIRALLPSILPQVALYTWKDGDDTVLGFAGVADQKIEMLFIHPVSRGKGIGRELTDFCIRDLFVTKVDVNEQNLQARGFYEKMGFVVTGREERDSLGRPFPLLLMELKSVPAK